MMITLSFNGGVIFLQVKVDKTGVRAFICDVEGGRLLDVTGFGLY